jgi:hypothetical protein
MVDVLAYVGDDEVAGVRNGVAPDVGWGAASNAVANAVYRRSAQHPTSDGPRSTAKDHQGAFPPEQVQKFCPCV